MNKNKVITIILALIMILGIVFVLTQGFNVEENTRIHNQVIISLEKEYNKEEVENIVKEALGEQKAEIKKVDIYDNEFSVEAKEITEEQKNTLVTKINEKYQTELKAEDVKVIEIPRMRLKDYVMPQVMELLWVTPIVLVYILVRYRKLGKLKTTVQTILAIAIAEIFVFSVIAIARLEIGSNIPAIILATYAGALLGIAGMKENELQKFKEEEEEKNKAKKA